ncbi:glycosyltransferase [Bizionia sediminis]|uniref:Glycosyltransferase n=1 Tax=Bizionia sediminis TaxID=1737064 RepID=A0ABW5KU27_9FLAO
MKILLIGEYSRLHNSLKEGLESLGIQVTLAGFRDDFKNYPVDIVFKERYNTGLPLFFKKSIYKLTGIDVTSRNIEKQFNQKKKLLTGFDCVQLINENPFNTVPKTEKRLLEYIFSHNKKVFLLSCGTDYISVKYAFNKQFRYSIYTPYEAGKISKSVFWHVLKWQTPPLKTLHKFVFKNIAGVIASDLDYHIPLQNHKQYLGMIPNPINVDKLPFQNTAVTDKIVIFHGINSRNFYKKGNDIFKEALAIIKSKYAQHVDIIEVENLPYSQYIESYNRAHIILDQVYAYDQGYNALEAMAKGKVVFTGAETEWLTHYHLAPNTIAINALPNATHIADKIEWLIENPEQLQIIGKNARAFIEKEHHYTRIAKRYLQHWQD